MCTQAPSGTASVPPSYQPSENYPAEHPIQIVPVPLAELQPAASHSRSRSDSDPKTGTNKTHDQESGHGRGHGDDDLDMDMYLSRLEAQTSATAGQSRRERGGRVQDLCQDFKGVSRQSWVIVTVSTLFFALLLAIIVSSAFPLLFLSPLFSHFSLLVSNNVQPYESVLMLLILYLPPSFKPPPPPPRNPTLLPPAPSAASCR